MPGVHVERRDAIVREQRRDTCVLRIGGAGRWDGNADASDASAVVGGSRNSFDRVIHLFFGLLLLTPLME